LGSVPENRERRRVPDSLERGTQWVPSSQERGTLCRFPVLGNPGPNYVLRSREWNPESCTHSFTWESEITYSFSFLVVQYVFLFSKTGVCFLVFSIFLEKNLRIRIYLSRKECQFRVPFPGVANPHAFQVPGNRKLACDSAFQVSENGEPGTHSNFARKDCIRCVNVLLFLETHENGL
jgi:hypothetical protein